MPIEKSHIWEIVKQIEENADDKHQQLGEIRATLLVNFSKSNRGRNPVLINSEDTTIAMLIKVLEHYVKS